MQEISLHILDLIQNSIEAGATCISLSIEENQRENLFLVKIADNGRGISPETIDLVSDPFYTTRNTRKVGLGISLFSMTCRQSGGELKIKSSPGRGTELNGKMEYDHWDRPPLGDIVGTVTSILAANPEMDFRYNHKYNGREFYFSTGQIREILEESIPINDIKILGWLKEYLSEQLANLYGGETGE